MDDCKEYLLVGFIIGPQFVTHLQITKQCSNNLKYNAILIVFYKNVTYNRQKISYSLLLVWINEIQFAIQILWNHLNSSGSIFVDCGFFAYSWECYFVDTWIFSFSKKENSLYNLFFCWECKFVGEGYQRIPRKLSHHEF